MVWIVGKEALPGLTQHSEIYPWLLQGNERQAPCHTQWREPNSRGTATVNYADRVHIIFLKRKKKEIFFFSYYDEGVLYFHQNFLLLPVKKRRKIIILFFFSFSEGGSLFSMIFSSSSSCQKKIFFFSFSEGGALYFHKNFLLFLTGRRKKYN